MAVCTSIKVTFPPLYTILTSTLQYVSGPTIKHAATFAGFHVKNIIAYTPVLAFWGAAAGFGVATFTENWPLFQKTFYSKIPVIGNHWIHEVDPEDQFF